MVSPETPHYFEYGVALGVLAMAFSRAVRMEVYRRQHGKCAICKKHFPKLQTHHIIPRSIGGTDDEDNAVGMCESDHKFADKMALRSHIFYPDVLDYTDLLDE